MSRWEMRKFLSAKNRGLVFGRRRLALEESYRNLCLVSPTGGGKTTRYIIPNVLDCAGSMVVTDPSGEIYRHTSGHLRKRGYRIQVVQPGELARSLRFNPLACLRGQQALKQLATALALNNAGASDPFWTTTATNLLYIGLSALANVEDDELIHLGNLRALLNHFGVHGEGVGGFMIAHLDDVVFAEYKAFLAQDAKVISSILSSARAALDLWSDPDIVRLTAENSLDIEALRRERTAIFIIVPEHQVRYFSLLVNLLYTAAFEHCLQQAEGEPVFFFLDEFGNLGRINNFAAISTTLRKRRCSISVVLQELSQLEAVYGRSEAKAIYSGGMGNRLFFGGLDVETCTYVERALGQKTEQGEIPMEEGMKSRQVTMGRPLMSADQVRMQEADSAIFISGNQRPAKLEIPPYYRDRRLARLAAKPPAPIGEAVDAGVKWIDFSAYRAS